MLTVKVGVLPGRVNEFALEEGATVEQAIEVADLDAEGYEVRLNGQIVPASSEVHNGDTVLLVKKIKGN